jgi:hypothetical protein
MNKKKMPQTTSKSNNHPTKSLFGENFLKYRICVVHGIVTMIDADLARIYGLSLDQFNEVVKNNIEHFGKDVRFQLKKNEFKALFPTLKQRRSSEQPYAFTEQGVYLLGMILEGDEVATRHMELIRFFKQLNDLLYPAGLSRVFLQAEQNARDIAELSAKIRELREMTHDLREKMDKAETMIRKAKKRTSGL